MTLKLSNLVKKQLPEFITTHYDSFSTFLEKYYEGLEVHGQPLDILFNLTKYYDINYYSTNLLERGSTLVQPLSISSNTIVLEDASGFPEEYGYLKIGTEICFYTQRDGNILTGVFRGVSGTTKLGDLYNLSKYESSDAKNHNVGDFVQNISNLFLFAIVKSFESQYLSSIPKNYLTDRIDKRTLIKNITDFYRSKGSEKSIKFIFNSLVETNQGRETSIRKPSDETLKSSTSDWISDYIVTINVVSGDPQNLVGEKIEQFNPYAAAIVEKVEVSGDPSKAKLFLDSNSINSTFDIFGYTELSKPISSSDQSNFVVDVVSTKSWKNGDNNLYINDEEFLIDSKNINQFFIIRRSGSSNILAGTKIYTRKPLYINGVKFQVTGNVYNLIPKIKNPYSSVGDPVLESNSASSSRNTIVYDVDAASYRWIANQNKQRPSVPLNSVLQTKLGDVNANVSAIFEDETYFYVCSSGYPSFDILGSSDSGDVENNKYLKLIRKVPVVNTEIYEVPRNDTAILLDGTLVYSKISESFVKYGPIVNVNVINKGFGYKNPPVVLVNGSPNKAKAILSGDVVSDIELVTDQIYKKTPNVVITSGRGAKLTALVTAGKISDLVITDPGEFYVSPPDIIITDKLGKGRLAKYTSRISSSGRIIGVDKIDPGRNYSAANTEVTVVPKGNGAEVELEIKKWYKNRYTELLSNIDDNGGILVDKRFPLKILGKTYAVIANPKKLRLAKNDNINTLLEETQTGHSKIIGYAYDGNPIYGPYGFEDPLHLGSSVVRLQSGYILNSERIDGPPVSVYSLGTFDEDYTWVPNINSGKTYLDQNNGRFCVTPEYPQGTYAYFTTIDASGNPAYPYIIGKNYYSIPVDSNYNSKITQDELPRSAKILDFSEYVENGKDFSASISAIESGSIDSFFIDSVTRQHNPGNKLYLNEDGTGGTGVEAEVGSVVGEDIDYLLSKKSTAVLRSFESVYLFKDYKFRQRNSGISGNIVDDVKFNDTIVLEGIVGEFDSTNTFDLIDPDTNQPVKVLNLLLNKSATFTAGSTVKLTDGKTKPNSVKATGVILESTTNQNSLRILVESGNFDLGIDSKILSLQSSTLSDDVGIAITTTRSISENIRITIIDYDYAIAKTSNSHGLVVNDSIDIFVNPDDNLTQKTYFVRKKLFQEIYLRDRKLNSRLNDTGIGKLTTLSGGFYSNSGVFSANLGNAEVEVTITEYLDFKNPQLTISVPGSGFVVGNRIPTLGGDGSGLIINIDEVGPLGQLVAVSVSTAGSDYINGDLVSPDQSNGNGAVIQIDYEIYNSVSSVEITDKGSGFEEDDILQLSNLVGVTQSRPAVFRIDHAGLSADNTEIKLTSVENVATDDLLKIDNEIVKVTNVDYQEKVVTVLRGQEQTQASRHFNRAIVSFYNFSYKFSEGEYIPEIGTDAFSPKVYKYDSETNLLTLTYEYGVNPSSTPNISISTFIKDESDPERKEVKISSVGKKIFKLELSENDESNFSVNPNIDIQLYYKYRFDTSHFSMSNTYLDFSPSLNYNLLTAEKVVGLDEPGSGLSNSFVDLKFGFGPRVSDNDFTNPVDLRFSNYYYFIVAGGVNTEGSKLQVLSDPLIGKKTISYVTNNKFLYKINSQPQENGTGDIQYVTSSKNAKGLIKSIKIKNRGVDYLKLPTIDGIITPEDDAAIWTPIMNADGGISEFVLVDQGKNYVSAKVIVEGDGTPGTYKAIVVDGKVTNVIVSDPGRGYTRVPKINIIETSHKIYPYSKNIGIPRSIQIINQGNFYSSDETTIPKYTSTYVLLLSNVDERNFTKGTVVKQFNSQGNIIFSGTVVEGLRQGSNVLKLRDIVGEPDLSIPIFDSTITSILFSDYEVEIRTYFDKIGYFNSEKSLISAAGSKITDSYYYQDYSYVIRSYTPIDIWRDLIKDVVHPAGFQLFGEVVVEAEVKAVPFPTEQPPIPFSVTLNVGVKDAFVFSTKTQVTELVESISLLDVQRGTGRLALDQEDLSSTSVKEVVINPSFDGYIDEDTGLIFGNKTFSIEDKNTGEAIFPYNESAILVSLNGIIQEPKVSYTINGSFITFTEAPLGPRVDEGQSLPGSTFTGKVFNFTNLSRNQESFRKVKDIFQRSGIWLDAANQIRFNKSFIVEETFGYLISKYPSIEFDTIKCRRDIGYIIDSFEHDLRFGGNTKTVTSGKFYYNAANELDFINNELLETRDAYFYAAKLCAAAIRNWDVTFIDDPSTADPQFEVIVSADSDIITVPSTFGIVEGMYISSGSQFPSGTKVLEIIDETNIRVSENAFSYITDEEVFVFEVPIGQVTLPPVGSTEVEFNYNGITIQTDAELIVSDGITVSITAQIAKLRQVRFSLSRINSGKFVDASNLISVNRQYIINETISYINLIFPTFSYPSETKCRRDIGYLIDAVIYHLKYGGNNRLVDYAEKYYFANKLNYINDELSETISAFEYSIALMLEAIENPGLPFQTLGYDVALDEENPLDRCVEVKSAINSYKEIYTSILENGPNLIQRDFGNVQKSGNYTDLLTYSNYNLIDDDELQLATQINGIWFASECANVISSLYTLHQSLDEILTTSADSVELTPPDYINGENKIFDLYTDDGQIFKTLEFEDLLVFINGILQRPSAYKILRSSDPEITDKIEFSEAPRWDQDEAQLRLQEGLSIDHFHAFSIGTYVRRKINEKFVDIRKDHTILALDGTPTEVITDPKYLTVFVDGVLQRRGKDYNISGNRIVFTENLKGVEVSGVKQTSKVDMFTYTGGTKNNNFFAFNFQRNTYASVARAEFYYDPGENDFYDIIANWSNPSNSHPILLYNGENPIGTISSIGKISDPYPGIELEVFTTNNPEINSSLPIVFKKNLPGVEDLEFTFSIVISEDTIFEGPETYVYGDIVVSNGVTVTIEDTATVVSADVVFDYRFDDDGERILERIVSPWMVNYGYVKNNAWRVSNKLTARILEGDKIKVDGENNFRTILSVPDYVRTTNYNTGANSSSEILGTIRTNPSLESPGGKGFSVTSIIDPITGSVTGLEYGTADTVRLTLLGEQIPNLGEGYGEGVYIDFIPVDGRGGGAFAKTLTFNGSIVGVKLVTGGSGYTQPPIAVITRGYDIIRSQRNISFDVSRNINIEFSLPSQIYQQVIISTPNLSEFGSYIQIGATNPIDEFVLNKILESEVLDVSLNALELPQQITQSLTSNSILTPSVDTLETLWTLPLNSSVSIGETTAAGAEIRYATESFVGAGNTLVTPETLNQLATLVNAVFNIGETILFVTSTNGFPNEGLLQIGTEVVAYNAKAPDRFFISIRGTRNTVQQLHPVGTIVKVYLDFLSVNRAPSQYIESENDIPAGTVQGDTQVQLLIYTSDSANNPPLDIVSALSSANIINTIEQLINPSEVDITSEVLKIDQTFTYNEIPIGMESGSSSILLFYEYNIDAFTSVYPAVISVFSESYIDILEENITQEITLTPYDSESSVSIAEATLSSDIKLLFEEQPDPQLSTETYEMYVGMVGDRVIQITTPLETRLEDIASSTVSMPTGTNAPPSDIISIIENEINVITLNAEVIEEVTTAVQEIASTEYDENIISLGLSLTSYTEIINIGNPSVVIASEFFITFQEVTTTVDKDAAEVLISDNPITEIVNTYDAPEHKLNLPSENTTSTDIKTTYEGGAIDEFVEINPSQIETN